MPRFTVLLRTHNNALTLGRALETVRIADEIVVVDEDSTDRTPQLAAEYGARYFGKEAATRAVGLWRHEWVLTLLPDETLSEALETDLLIWKQKDAVLEKAYAIPIREQQGEKWKKLDAEVRLVRSAHVPGRKVGAFTGEILRFRH
jgi:glycosyltransferase involved in cell wall biosynthesis